jgi:transposase
MQDSSGGRRKFDQEFKQGAVKLVIEGKRTVADVARSLGIHDNLLHRWKRQYEEDPQDSFPGKGRMRPQDEELKRLQKENANLREEREILKKALAIFSKHPK